MPNILLIGNGAREHAIAEALMRSGHQPRLFSYMKSNNPGIASLSEKVATGSYNDMGAIQKFAGSCRSHFAIIGPEDPLNNGIVDMLKDSGIPAIGPTKSLARLETSKSFTRQLLEKYHIPGNPKFKNFSSLSDIESYISELQYSGNIVIKPDGLTGGKGVLVQGDHFHSKDDALRHCQDILKEHAHVIIEEKMEGEEFSLQCFCDGKTVAAAPPVQDHKRRFVDDKGPNTGGMGSYSYENHTLPFLKSQDVPDALAITQKVADAIYRETGNLYKGIMYGGFIAAREGVKLLEYNARLGDPEAMNILPLLKTDFVELCQAIIEGTLDRLKIIFDNKATVCKYVVPKGYGLPANHPEAGSASSRINIGNVGQARLYYASVDKRADGLYMSASRAVAAVGIAETISKAERIAEHAISAIQGAVDHRPDIGTKAAIEKRVEHMKQIRG
jgi:phosphoribosylamine--glycine ligase